MLVRVFVEFYLEKTPTTIAVFLTDSLKNINDDEIGHFPLN